MRFLVLEDDAAQAAYLVRSLEEESTTGDDVVSCVVSANGEEAQRILRRESFDLAVLDWNVPGLDGTELLQWLRVWQDSAMPVLMLSSRGSEHDVAEVLNAGADDYIIKPFRPKELQARIQRLLARRNPQVASAVERFGNWEFNRASHHVLYHAKKPGDAPPESLELTAREFKLALVLFQNMGRVLSRGHLLESAGYSADEMSSRTLDTHIYRLRNKLSLGPARELNLRTVYGRGYCLEMLGEADPTPDAQEQTRPGN